jgi:hypothetical protein
MKTHLPVTRTYSVRAVKARIQILGLTLWRFWTRPIIVTADNSTEAIRLAIIRRAIPSGKETVATLTHLHP